MSTLLIKLTVVCLVSGSELAWFLMCTLLTVAHLLSECELAWLLMCTLLNLFLIFSF
ncbi:hypothetical protein K443DRAFT_632074 [Laccaria amethystina LaAM-08-1]|uniref:Uncharacterized protein n=1 Tax=Laccaria amethystina LaAM-08-1 TaxID=1095629 RepID=A0A0C9X7K9_9AGAR|nr:hypothetical protein K443DRAFT_632074 [Laccaria amethystina LaAM-08-1]